MKKIFLFALVAVAAISCKKEINSPQQPTTGNVSMEEQVATVIKKADSKLYTKIYGASALDFKTTDNGNKVRYLPGVFYIPAGTGPASGIDNATCLGTTGVCMVIVSSPKTMDNNVSPIVGNIDESYTDQSAQLIINTGETPVVRALNSIEVSLQNGVHISAQ